MERKNDNFKVAIIGPYPPPYGGISIHIERVLYYLDREGCNYDFFLENRTADNIPSHYKFYGFGKLISLIRLFFRKYTLIHHHSPHWKMRVILSIYGILGKNIYLHIHGSSLKDSIKDRGIKSVLTKKVLKFVNIIADNEDIAALARKDPAKSVICIDAFLPPLCRKGTYKEFFAKYGESLQKKFVISMVGWVTYYESEDLYGFDIALQALKRFKKEINERVILLASINGIRSEELHRRIKNYIIANNLTENTLFIYKDLPEIWPIYVVSDVFIRPTCSDGSALSVKEAMWYETPVITSNCVPRPQGVILFENRSSDELFEKLRQIYDSQKEPQNPSSKIERVAYKEFRYKLIDEIYNSN